MNCYMCDAGGKATPAVAVCRHCGVALCRTHFDEDLLLSRPSGMTRHACTHSPVHKAAEAARRRAQAAVRSEVTV
jgi:Uncharacterized protein conserved in archaea (DUF2180)